MLSSRQAPCGDSREVWGRGPPEPQVTPQGPGEKQAPQPSSLHCSGCWGARPPRPAPSSTGPRPGQRMGPRAWLKLQGLRAVPEAGAAHIQEKLPHQQPSPKQRGPEPAREGDPSGCTALREVGLYGVPRGRWKGGWTGGRTFVSQRQSTVDVALLRHPRCVVGLGGDPAGACAAHPNRYKKGDGVSPAAAGLAPPCPQHRHSSRAGSAPPPPPAQLGPEKPAKVCCLLEDSSCPSWGCSKGARVARRKGHLCCCPQGHPEDTLGPPACEHPAPRGDAWGMNAEQRPVGLVTADPAFTLSHRRVS